jgi:hypothetical protein
MIFQLLRKALILIFVCLVSGFSAYSQLDVQGVVSSQTDAKNPPLQKIIEDSGFSVQLSYWLSNEHPLLRGGAAYTGTVSPDLDFTGTGRQSPGIMIGVPAGPQNTLRFSDFRTNTTGNTTASTDLNLLGTDFTSGDYLSTSNKLQVVKVGWDCMQTSSWILRQL